MSKDCSVDVPMGDILPIDDEQKQGLPQATMSGVRHTDTWGNVWEATWYFRWRLVVRAASGWSDPGADPAADWDRKDPDVEAQIAADKKFDAINPNHYRSHPSGIECIEITEHMGFLLGNATKYIWRADLKHDSPIDDIDKAIWYLERYKALRS